MRGRPGGPSLALAVALLGAVGGPALAAAPAAGEVVQPVLQSRASIDYPEELRGLDPPPAGRVVVKLVVGVDGVPKELELTQGVHPRLDALALEAVASLRYSPGLYRGQPIEVVLSVAIDVAAPEPPPPEPGRSVGEGEPEAGAAEAPAVEGPVRLRGRLLEAGQRTPVAGAAILVVPAPPDLPLGEVRRTIYGDDAEPGWSVRSITDDHGDFEVRGLPSGRVRVVILSQGFERLDYVEEVSEGKILEVRYYQRRMQVNPYRTVVSTGRGGPEEVSRRTITVEEINNIPGTQGDALKSIQNFPGVARSPFGAGLLVIRGSAPSDSKVYLGYHEIPQLFHFGAITSVFNSDILAQIDFIPGNFDSRYGDAIGGILNVNPRKGRRDGFHGYADADVFDVGVLVEGPIKKGSFALSGRRSYIDSILKAALPEDIGLNFTQAPRYYDYQSLFDYPVGGGELSVRIFGSDDRLSLVTRDPGQGAGSGDRAGTAVLFHRGDLVYRKQDGPWEFLITPSFIFQSAKGGFGDLFRFQLDRYEFSGRAEVSRQLSERAAIRLGTEVQTGKYNISAEAPSFPAGSGLGETGVLNIAKDVGGDYASPAVYATATIGLGERFTLFPGVRAHYFARVLRKLAVDPRVRFAWQVGESTTIKGGVGLYSQAPDIFEFNPVWGNPNVWLERSVHTSLGVAQVFGDALTVEVTGFHKHVWDRVTGSTMLYLFGDDVRPENFANQAIGRIYGGEFLLRKDLTKKLFGWVSYTLMKSEQMDAPGEPWVPFDFDQRHILTVIGVYKLPRNWQVGGRFRLVSGNPTTGRTDGVYDAQTGGYLPIDGPRNGERLPAFHQLDLRVDKRWILRRALVSLYLDVQNVYNRQNGEAWNYSFNFQQRALTTGLPIIPSLGTRIEF